MPPVPTSSSSSYRSERTFPTMRGGGYPRAVGLQRGFQGGLPGAERFVELRVRDHERHEHADAVPVHPGLQEEETTLDRVGDDPRSKLGRRLAVLVRELDREHRAEPPHVGDLREPPTPALHAR